LICRHRTARASQGEFPLAVSSDETFHDRFTERGRKLMPSRLITKMERRPRRSWKKWQVKPYHSGGQGVDFPIRYDGKMTLPG
jgi:hypothetical protein